MMIDRAAAVTEVEESLREWDREIPPGWTVELVQWNVESVRIAEVSYASPDNKAGASFMQSDLPWGLAVCAQAERCVLARMYDWSADEIANEDGTLHWLVNQPREATS